MKSIVISSIGRRGKSFIAVGLSLNLKNCAYLKPISERKPIGNKIIDEDVALMKNICGLSLDDEVLCPGLFSEDVDIEKIKDSYKKLSKDRDYILIESDLIRGEEKHLGGFHIAKALETKIILVVEERIGYRDEVEFLKELGGDLIAGVILNKTREIKDDKFLETIPYKEELSFISAYEIKEGLDANCLAGVEGLSKKVEHILIGAMTPQYASFYFERLKNELIITGGDRTDLLLSALTEDTSCVIATGDIIPPPEVIRKAERRKIPLFSVPWDTLTTSNKVEAIIPRITFDDKIKLSLIKELTKGLPNKIFGI